MAGIRNVTSSALVQRIGWGTQRFVRSVWRRMSGYLGWAGMVTVFAGLAMFVAVWIWDSQERRLAEIQKQSRLQAVMHRQVPPPVIEQGDARSRLRDFENYLLQHEEIPTVVQDVLMRADAEGLRLIRGDYKAQSEPQGLFMRYRMTLPVKGDADAIHRFMLDVLKENRTLTLENVQFKRARSDSREIEARIQWVLLTRVPEGRPPVVAGEDR